MVDFMIRLRPEDAPSDIREALDNPRAAVIASVIEDLGDSHSYSVCIVISRDKSVDITDANSAVAIGYLFGNLLKIAPSDLHKLDLVARFNDAVEGILNERHEIL